MARVLALTPVLIAATACYTVALVPGARQKAARVLVVVGADPRRQIRDAISIAPTDDDDSGESHDTLRERLAADLTLAGFAPVVERRTQVVSTGALLDDPWPDDLCDRAIARGMQAALWVVPRIEVTPTVVGGLAEIDLSGHLVGCPDGALLWRDRALGRVGIDLKHLHDVVLSDVAKVGGRAWTAALEQVVDQLLASLRDDGPRAVQQ